VLTVSNLPRDLSSIACTYLHESVKDKSSVARMRCYYCELFVVETNLRVCEQRDCSVQLHQACLDYCVQCEDVPVPACEDHDRLFHCMGPICRDCYKSSIFCEDCRKMCCKGSCFNCNAEGCEHCDLNRRSCSSCVEVFCDDCVGEYEQCLEMLCAKCRAKCCSPPMDTD
jgi:hypothetical protein